MTQVIPALSVAELAAEMQSGHAPLLLDVREPHEVAHCAIAGHLAIPLGQLPGRINELPKERPIVVQCHHGGRSAKATQYLLLQGFADVRNLSGGIDAWSLEVDPSVPRY